MSITALEPTTQNSEALNIHKSFFAPGVITEARRFPEAFRAPVKARTRRCLRQQQPPVRELDIPTVHELEEALRTERPEHPGTAAQEVTEKLFPSSGSLKAPRESVAAVVHAAAPAVLEVLAGARPARQLSSALSPECMGKLVARMELAEPQRPDPTARCYSNPRVMRMRITQVLPLVFEAAVILRDMQKVRATALRIERWHGRWQVTAMEIG